MSLLSVEDVTVRFGGINALRGVDLELNQGEILGLIGPNGAGKTTLFNCISGVVRPNTGRIRFRGRDLVGMTPHRRARLGIARTFQNLQLWPSMTVLENLKLPIDALEMRNIAVDALRLPFSGFAEHSSDERARAVLHALGLLDFEHTRAADLPVGIQRRVEIARALCLRPRLLLLDEPAAGLDADETLELADALLRVRDRFKVSMLLVDHDMSLVMRACQYIYVLDFGEILSRGKPEQVREDPKVVTAYLGEGRADADPRIEPGGSPAPRAEPEPLLEVEGLAAGYGGLPVLRDVNLRVGRGEVVAVIGANGAGKTTTLRAISGIIRPSAGSVRFDGASIAGLSPQAIVAKGLLHVPQGRGLFPRLTVEETLRLSAYSGYGGSGFEVAYDAFPVLKKRRNQLAGTMSGGEQQMLALARALLVKPQLVMIDEMSQGLAPAVVQRLFDWLEEFRSAGVAVLLVEQFVDSALALADRAYVIEQGAVAHEGDAAVLRADKALIASAYLGAAAGAEPVEHAPERPAGPRTEMLDEMQLKLPAELKRTLQERAAREGRTPEELIAEFLAGAAFAGVDPAGPAANGHARTRAVELEGGEK